MLQCVSHRKRLSGRDSGHSRDQRTGERRDKRCQELDDGGVGKREAVLGEKMRQIILSMLPVKGDIFLVEYL